MAHEIQRPRRGQALYVNPYGDEPHQCKRCMMFSRDGRCHIHPPDMEVSPDGSCGYWVGGKPMPKAMPDKQDVQHVTPETSGYEEGIEPYCGSCRHYDGDERGGFCMWMADEEGGDARVEHWGCCALWEPEGENERSEGDDRHERREGERERGGFTLMIGMMPAEGRRRVAQRMRGMARGG